MPRTSVIIPCYNHARYLPEAVGSVAAQTYGNFEIIIVNDGSTDGTREVALGLMEKHKGCDIKLMEQENAGLPTARNNGINAARGEYIVPLDADDVLLPRYLEKTVPALDSDPSLGLAYSWSEHFGEKTGVIRHGGLTRKNLLKHEGPPCTALIRKSAWKKVGGYKPAMSRGYEDWEFLMSLFEAGYGARVVPEPLFMYRQHKFSMIKDVTQNHSLEMQRRLKLLHPKMFEPLLCRISVRLARAVIWLKSYTRDPVMRYVYVRYPKVHEKLRMIKYGLFVR